MATQRTKAKLALLMTIPVAAACAKVDLDLRSKSNNDKDDAGLNFVDAPSDGRPTQFAVTDATKYANIDFTKVHPKTQEFYGLATPTAVKIRNSPEDFKKLFEYTNVQESIPEAEFLAAVKRACLEEYPGSSLRACIDEGIAKSGALVFQPKVPRANPANLNDEKYALDVAYGTVGVTGVVVTAPNGTSHQALMFTCIGCHDSSFAIDGSDNTRMLHVDGRGDWAGADGLANRSLQPYVDKLRSVVNNPSDAIWAISAKAKSAGMLAAQYERIRSIHGSRYYATDADLAESIKKMDAQKLVNSGWLFAMMAAGTSAKKSCAKAGNNSIGTIGATKVTSCRDTLSDLDVAEKTERVTLDTFLPGGSRQNILDEIFVSGNPVNSVPTRAQRSLIPNIFKTDDEMVAMRNNNFAIEYLTTIGTDMVTYDNISARYLLGATSGSLLMPANIDSDIAKAWYGPAATPTSAKAALYENGPRTVLRGFFDMSPLYHKARYTQPEPVAKVYAPTMTMAEINQAQTYMNNACYSCHVTATFDLNQAQTTCGVGTTDCSIAGKQRPTWSWESFYKQNTPTSMFAKRMFAQIGSIPAALSGVNGVSLNTDIQSKSSRIPFLNLQSLTDWGYLSFADALKLTRPAPFYAVVSPVVAYTGETKIRRMNVGFSLAGNGVTGVQELRCNKTQTFNIGGVVKSCRDTLIQLSGATPRLLGEDNAIGVHANVARPESSGVAPATVAKYLSGLSVGRLNVAGYRSLTLTYVPELWSDASGSSADGGGTGGGGLDPFAP